MIERHLDFVINSVEGVVQRDQTVQGKKDEYIIAHIEKSQGMYFPSCISYSPEYSKGNFQNVKRRMELNIQIQTRYLLSHLYALMFQLVSGVLFGKYLIFQLLTLLLHNIEGMIFQLYSRSVELLSMFTTQIASLCEQIVSVTVTIANNRETFLYISNVCNTFSTLTL